MRRCASDRTSTRPASRRMRRCFETAGWLTRSSWTRPPTARSETRSRSRIRLRLGSARTSNGAAIAIKHSYPAICLSSDLWAHLGALGGEDDRCPQSALEKPFALLGGVALQLDVVPTRVELEQELRPAPASIDGRLHRLDRARPGAVEGEAEAQEPGQDPDELLVRVRQTGELEMGRLGRALAVVAGHERDQLDLVVGEPYEEIGVADDVVAVQVVAVVGHEQPDVRQQSRSFEQLLGRGVELVQRPGLLEQLQGQLGGVIGVLPLAGCD